MVIFWIRLHQTRRDEDGVGALLHRMGRRELRPRLPLRAEGRVERLHLPNRAFRSLMIPCQRSSESRCLARPKSRWRRTCNRQLGGQSTPLAFLCRTLQQPIHTCRGSFPTSRHHCELSQGRLSDHLAPQWQFRIFYPPSLNASLELSDQPAPMGSQRLCCGFRGRHHLLPERLRHQSRHRPSPPRKAQRASVQTGRRRRILSNDCPILRSTRPLNTTEDHREAMAWTSMMAGVTGSDRPGRLLVERRMTISVLRAVRQRPRRRIRGARVWDQARAVVLPCLASSGDCAPAKILGYAVSNNCIQHIAQCIMSDLGDCTREPHEHLRVYFEAIVRWVAPAPHDRSSACWLRGGGSLKSIPVGFDLSRQPRRCRVFPVR